MNPLFRKHFYTTLNIFFTRLVLRFFLVRRLMHSKLARKEFDYMQKQGICRVSLSSRASPRLLVSKKYGTFRPCNDYRRLNVVTKPDRYPLPHIHDFTGNLYGKIIFSKLNIVRAYHRILFAKEDIQKSAVTTPFGLFEFPVMCIGLRNAAHTFQCLVNSILFGVFGR